MSPDKSPSGGFRFSKTNRLLALCSAVILIPAAATAVPYATSLTNNAGVISFRLNEDADTVRIISDGGATTNNLGAVTKGLTVTNLGVAGAFQVQVSKSAPLDWVQTSVDTNTLVNFSAPRGVSVLNDPAHPLFGRAFVANGNVGTASGRSVGKGIYMLNSDQTDASGLGDTPATGGITFDASASSPYRVKVGPDNLLYICDWSDGNGNLFRVDPDVTTNGFVLQALTGPATIPVGTGNNHGSVAAVAIAGTLGGGDLTIYTVDEDLQSDRDSASATEMNSLWRYPVGAGPLPTSVFDPTNKLVTPGIQFVSQTMDLERRKTDGLLYMTQRRSVGTEPGVYIVDPATDTVVTNTLEISVALGNTTDFMRDAAAVAVSEDGKKLATIRWGDHTVVVAELDGAGVPDLANRVQFSAFPAVAAARGLAFDIAGNLHIISSGSARYRVFSPGGTTVATTGSAGTFTLSEPFSTVTVAAADDQGAETGPDTGTFTLTRAGGNLGVPLTVTYTMGGTASNGVDYVTLPGSVTFAAGAATTNITLTPIDDSEAELAETAILSLNAGASYTAGVPNDATVTIIDNEPAAVSIEVTQPTMYERIADDRVTYQLVRKGETNSAVQVNLTYSGTASNGVDHINGPASVIMDFGVITSTFSVNPLDDGLVEGSESVIATVSGVSGGSVGTPASATATILDDDLPAESPVFSDSFESDTSANWTVRHGSFDGLDDRIALFAYDYSAEGIPPAPGSGTTLGLKLSVNKNDGSASSAGVNVYPNGQSFSGDYALRFNMYAIVNSGAGTTEHSLFGINHSGTKTNWVRQSSGVNPAVDIDGLWYAMVLDTSSVNGLGHVHYAGNGPTNTALVVSNRLASTLVNVFKTPPFYTAGGSAGSPSNPAFSGTPTWVDVEVKKVGSLITCTINGTVVFETTNTTSFTSGNIMLGHNDQFDSIGLESATIFDNVRVVSLAVPSVSITAVRIVGGNVQVDFSAGSGDTVGSFQLHKASVVTGPYANDAGAVITQLSPGSFRATTAVSGSQQYFRIARP